MNKSNTMLFIHHRELKTGLNGLKFSQRATSAAVARKPATRAWLKMQWHKMHC